MSCVWHASYSAVRVAANTIRVLCTSHTWMDKLYISTLVMPRIHGCNDEHSADIDAAATGLDVSRVSCSQSE